MGSTIWIFYYIKMYINTILFGKGNSVRYYYTATLHTNYIFIEKRLHIVKAKISIKILIDEKEYSRVMYYYNWMQIWKMLEFIYIIEKINYLFIISLHSVFLFMTHKFCFTIIILRTGWFGWMGFERKILKV